MDNEETFMLPDAETMLARLEAAKLSLDVALLHSFLKVRAETQCTPDEVFQLVFKALITYSNETGNYAGVGHEKGLLCIDVLVDEKGFADKVKDIYCITLIIDRN